MKPCFVTVFLLVRLSVFAQFHANHLFLGEGITDDTSSLYGTAHLDFNVDPFVIKKENCGLRFSACAAQASDSMGNLLFYSNGMRVYNKNYTMMENGDTLNPGTVWEDREEYKLGYVGLSGISLPAPGQVHQYYLLHVGTSIANGLAFTPLYATRIDMAANGGLGKVLEKNVVIGNFPKYSLPVAVKHANGVDWWILIEKGGTGKMQTFLLSSQGVVEQPDNEILTHPDPYPGGSSTAVSPDGTRLVIAVSLYTDMYDFDRCTGRLSNPRSFAFPDGAGKLDVYVFSPDSRFLYMSRTALVTQLDLQADTFGLALADTVQWFDFSYLMFPFLGNGFSFPTLLPNGQITYALTNDGDALHLMHRPTVAGVGCDLENVGLKLGRFTISAYWNLPNYRLGVLEGSPCDTVASGGRPPGFVHTRYEDFLEQQAHSRRQVVLSTPLPGGAAEKEPAAPVLPTTVQILNELLRRSPSDTRYEEN